MRTAGIILALLFATATASAQATFEFMGAPDAAIRTVVWTVPGSAPPPQRTALTPEYRLPDRPRLPTTEGQPEDPLFSMPSSPPPRPEPKRHPPVVGAYLEVENRGDRVIKAVGWEVSLVDKASGTERRRLRFRTETEVHPGQTVAQKYEFPLDSDWRWYAASKGRGVRVVVKIEHLVYAGGTEWRREKGRPVTRHITTACIRPAIAQFSSSKAAASG
ncbi:MAG TPA: hypothetical protein VM095_13010 [Pyrinomonadaceae bacterium]|nr:hypothetical protein [Pyrinomonadaceae bacterium]